MASHYTFSVTVDGWPPFVMGGASHGAVRASAYSSYAECRQVTFKDFLRIVRVRRCPVPDNDGYDYVRRAYGVDPKVGQRCRLVNEGPSTGEVGEIIYPGLTTASIHVIVDGRTFAVRVHPMNVELLAQAEAA